jgi:hypothetical protein
MKVFLICTLLICTSLKAVSAFDPKDLPFIKLDFSGIDYAQDVSSQLEKMTEVSIQKCQLCSEDLKNELILLNKKTYSGKLAADKPEKISPNISAYKGSNDQSWGFVGARGNSSFIIDILLYVDKEIYEKAPLTSSYLVVHEALGHLPHFLNVLQKNDNFGAAKLFTNQNYMKDFYDYTHIVSPAMEVQLFSQIDLGVLKLELENSKLSEEKRSALLDMIQQYETLGALDYIRWKASWERCGSPDSCYDEAKFQKILAHIRSQGFQF